MTSTNPIPTTNTTTTTTENTPINNDGNNLTTNQSKDDDDVESSEMTSSTIPPSESSQNDDSFTSEHDMDSSTHKHSAITSSSIPISNSSSSLEASMPTKKQALSSVLFLYSLLKLTNQRQKKLTAPPLVFHQPTPHNDDLRNRMGWTLRQSIRPSIIATSGITNSMAAYARGGPTPRPTSQSYPKVTNSVETILYPSYSAKSLNGRLIPGQDHFHFREILTMGSDGAKLAIDWELPDSIIPPPPAPPIPPNTNVDCHINMTIHTHPLEYSILNGPIQTPIVLILHGINNDTDFGYIRRLMRTCTDRGWIAAGMNFRGCGGVPLETPRLYTGAYTGDLRSVVNQLSHRLELAVDMGLRNPRHRPTIIEGEPAPLFLVGNSLGANVMVKYLGEEGLASNEHPKALPRCLAGGVSLGNPLVINSGKISFPWGHILVLGLKKSILMQYKRFREFRETNFQSTISKALWQTHTVGEFDKVVAPFMIRNEPTYPFLTKIGYEDPDAGPKYWKDACSYTHVENVTIPLLKISAQDDFLVAKHAVSKINHCLHNPNLMVVKTKSGGHLGWFHVGSEEGACGILGRSWADQATADFIAAVMDKKQDEYLWTTNTNHLSDATKEKRRNEIEMCKQKRSTIRSKM